VNNVAVSRKVLSLAAVSEGVVSGEQSASSTCLAVHGHTSGKVPSGRPEEAEKVEPQ
jgi:hypothetical protein